MLYCLHNMDGNRMKSDLFLCSVLFIHFLYKTDQEFLGKWLCGPWPLFTKERPFITSDVWWLINQVLPAMPRPVWPILLLRRIAKPHFVRILLKLSKVMFYNGIGRLLSLQIIIYWKIGRNGKGSSNSGTSISRLSFTSDHASHSQNCRRAGLYTDSFLVN